MAASSFRIMVHDSGGSTLRNSALKMTSTVFIIILAAIGLKPLFAQQSSFRNAPTSATEMKNPYANNATAAAAGKTIYAKTCAQCHGNNRQGMGPAPALDSPHVRTANPGELFWFITNGKPSSGMPAWPNLSKQQRWQIVTLLQSK
jgi:mono/diheme cytochrome c family protein